MQEIPAKAAQNASASQSENVKRLLAAVLSALAAVPALGSDENGSWEGHCEIDDGLVTKRYAVLTESERRQVRPVIERVNSILSRQRRTWSDAEALIRDLRNSTWSREESESDPVQNM